MKKFQRADAFLDNRKITSVMIPDTVTAIGPSAFLYCKGLKIVRMEDSVTELGCEAFYRCTRLSDIRLSNRITELLVECFDGCNKLKKIILPEQLTVIGDFAPYSTCPHKQITIPEGVKEWDYYTLGLEEG